MKKDDILCVMVATALLLIATWNFIDFQWGIKVIVNNFLYSY